MKCPHSGQERGRNAGREEFKRVSDDVIDKMYSRFATQKIPSGITVIKPDELDSIWMKKRDFSQYKSIIKIGVLSFLSILVFCGVSLNTI